MLIVLLGGGVLALLIFGFWTCLKAASDADDKNGYD